ncbi:hypothetical protein AX17_003755 [Amanita inopinata Kibby_2008]|nr:hypothetical protein AX17_003755 [Amanita inopinata Kibby_2008]
MLVPFRTIIIELLRLKRSVMRRGPSLSASWLEHVLHWLNDREMVRYNLDAPKTDIVRAILWIDAKFSQSLDVVYSLYHCVREFQPPFLARIVLNQPYTFRHSHITSLRVP